MLCHILFDNPPLPPYILPMNADLQFDLNTHQLTGPAGSLSIPLADQQAHRFLMLLEGQCLHGNAAHAAERFGFCRQRYYQLLDDFNQGGLPALLPQKTGPKSNHRRTDQVVRQVLRYLFLDPDVSAEVITQKLRQTRFSISLRSVCRIIADLGLQKKTLRSQPPNSPSAPAHPTRRQGRSRRTRRPRQRRTRRPATPGR